MGTGRGLRHGERGLSARPLELRPAHSSCRRGSASRLTSTTSSGSSAASARITSTPPSGRALRQPPCLRRALRQIRELAEQEGSAAVPRGRQYDLEGAGLCDHQQQRPSDLHVLPRQEPQVPRVRRRHQQCLGRLLAGNHALDARPGATRGSVTRFAGQEPNGCSRRHHSLGSPVP